MRNRRKQWPVRPNPILKDETFTSWVSRVALGNGLPPQTFYVNALGWHDVWNKDLDFFDDEEKLQFLADKTGKEVSDIMRLKLDDQRFIVNSSGFASSQEFTTFCPDCLDVKKPYFRKAWRSALIVTCEHHGTFLESRCSSCFSPIRLLSRTDTVPLNVCSDCEKRLDARALPVKAPDYLQAFTHKITQTLSGDWFELSPGKHVHPDLFLSGFPALADIVSRNEVWERVYRHLNLNELFAKPTLLYFHRRESFVDRCVLLLCLSWILADWPERFAWAVQDLSSKTHHYLLEYRDVPFWLWSAVKEQFDRPVEHRNDDENQALLRMISEGRLKEFKYYRTFGRRHYVRVNGRRMKNFRNIYKEARKIYASAQI